RGVTSTLWLAMALLDDLQEILLRVEDRLVGAELSEAFGLCFTAGAGDDIGPGELGKVGAADAAAAAGAEDENLLARLDLANGGHHPVSRAVGDRQARRLLEADVVGNLE